MKDVTPAPLLTLAERLRDDPYQGYAYSYPHKMAYRPFDPPLALESLWSAEQRDALFLYVHLPFCEMRCGFCNLFTTTNPAQGLVSQYLAALELQCLEMHGVLGSHAFIRGAIGGGTPTFLSVNELEQLFGVLRRNFVLKPEMGLSCELSPATTDLEKVRLLKENGVTRASLGVQSFLLAETKALGRPQQPEVVRRALGLLKSAEFPIVNVDLIYGAVGQTPASWQLSLQEAVEHEVEEIFLYPLYVRPLTGLDRIGRDPSDLREQLYLQGRDYLEAQGYRQISMRLFRKGNADAGPEYCCQEDGMVGLGAGARSYTTAVHYCTEYAVGKQGIGEIISDYVERGPARHAEADYGCFLVEEEQRRRYVIKSLLRSSGLSASRYTLWCGRGLLQDFPQLAELVCRDLARWQEADLFLTPAGFARSDTIGPWLYSQPVVDLMRGYHLS